MSYSANNPFRRMANRMRGQDPDYIPESILKDQSKLSFFESGLTKSQYDKGEKLSECPPTDFDSGYAQGYADAISALLDNLLGNRN